MIVKCNNTDWGDINYCLFMFHINFLVIILNFYEFYDIWHKKFPHQLIDETHRGSIKKIRKEQEGTRCKYKNKCSIFCMQLFTIRHTILLLLKSEVCRLYPALMGSEEFAAPGQKGVGKHPSIGGFNICKHINVHNKDFLMFLFLF